MGYCGLILLSKSAVGPNAFGKSLAIGGSDPEHAETSNTKKTARVICPLIWRSISHDGNGCFLANSCKCRITAFGRVTPDADGASAESGLDPLQSFANDSFSGTHLLAPAKVSPNRK